MTPQTQIAAVLPLIRTLRGRRVILDSDLALLYGVQTKRLNEQYRRNRRRFPRDFAFPLSQEEVGSNRSQFATGSRHRDWRIAPIAYTEHGAVMAANVLNSDKAIIMSVEVVRAFIRLRRAVLSQEKIARKVAELERAVAARLDGQDRRIDKLFEALEGLIGDGPPPPKKRIGFEPRPGQDERAQGRRF